MKPRTQFFLAITLLTLFFGIALFTFTTRNQEPLPTFPATINRDCAPWDGSAFTVSIPDEGSIISISIYHSPEIRFPVTFSFPDETMKDGIALLILPVGLPAELSGKVTFQRVEQGIPAEGKFELVTDTGQYFSGKFRAEWGNVTAYCG